MNRFAVAGIEVYRSETAPLIDYYRGQGRLREVEGTGPADEVYRQLVRMLGPTGAAGTTTWST